MAKKKVITVFDIGKTNKKIFLFDENLEIVYQQEKQFQTIHDEDGFACEDIEQIKDWMISSLTEIIKNNEFEVRGINFSTYGASLVFLDDKGNRLTPLYNYLKPVSDTYRSSLFEKYGGEDEFCRKTASPAYGKLLNSGIQLLWLKEERPEIFRRIKWIMHLPQYFSYLFTGEIHSEYTSVGCHTFIWDFQKNDYHTWLDDTGIHLPKPKPNAFTIPIRYAGKHILSGIGIHDSSSSLVPYIAGSPDSFTLVSTGTWSISMNPFNHFPLTRDDLENDCLMYLSADRIPVKSSRFFLGHIHDMNLKKMSGWFHTEEDHFKTLTPDASILSSLSERKERQSRFFRNGIPTGYTDENIDLSVFENYSKAYHAFMYDLTFHNAESIKRILCTDKNTKYLHITGGFSRNEIYMRLLARFFPNMAVCTSSMDNFSALGAALVIWHSMETKRNPGVELNLHQWKP